MAIYRFVEPRLGRMRLREWRWGALRVLLVLALVIAFTALGLALLDNSDANLRDKLMLGLWNAVNLVSTLGDFSNFDARQKLFMMGAMLCVMITGAYAITQLTGLLSSPQAVAYRENRRMEHALDKLSGHLVVIGYVGLGKLLADQLRDAGQQVVIIDRDEGNAGLASEAGFNVIKGDAGNDDGVLKIARIGVARALFVTTADAHRNLTLTLMSHTLNPKLRIVVAGSDESWGRILRRAGASDVVIANRLLADAMLACLGQSGASI